MNAKYIRQSIVAACAVAASTGALAHEEYSENGPNHWIQHVAEAKVPAKGVFGSMRSDREPAATPVVPRGTSAAQRDESPFRGLGGIGGENMN